MTLADLVAPEGAFHLRLAEKGAVLTELALRGARATTQSVSDIMGALVAREALGSTGVGHGVALPHARLAGLARPVGLLARLARPIDWAAIDGAPVDLAFLLLSPRGDDAGHLAALAAVSRRLRAAGDVLRAAEPAALRDALIG